MTTHSQHPWLNRYAWAVVAATTLLIFVGAMVTTKGVGMAVPDWPTTFGSFNPPGWWKIEGVNWEHGHRLTGAAIGVLVIGLTIGMWRAYPNSRLRWLGVAALIGVSVQGIFGGLRVTEVSTVLAVVHGCFAQVFFALLIVIATVTAPSLTTRFHNEDRGRLRKLRLVAGVFVAITYIQLVIAASMRHYHAGLAIPDFPLALGRIIPPLGSFAVTIHFAHRVWALVVVAAAIVMLVTVYRLFASHRNVTFAASLIFWLLLLQVALGAAVIWHLRAPLPTTLHVVNGASILGIGVYLLTQSFAPVATEAPVPGGASVADEIQRLESVEGIA